VGSTTASNRGLKAFTFDVIISNLNNKPYEIDNIDIQNAEKIDSELLRVKKTYRGK